MTLISKLKPEEATKIYHEILDRDVGFIEGKTYLTNWLFAQRQLARNQNTGMHFYSFIGNKHLELFFSYLKGFAFPDYFEQESIKQLIETSVMRDTNVYEKLRLRPDPNLLERVAKLNAQDFILKSPYDSPERYRPKVTLDFGAGHGRQANLLFSNSNREGNHTLIAVDGIISSYLTQSLYYEALGLIVGEYIFESEDITFSNLSKSNQVIHIPTWRMDIIPDNSVDEILAVQVLREVTPELFFYLLDEFFRILRPGGKLYIRDHLLFHNPNMIPQDSLLVSSGFVLEWAPHLIDGVDLHGIPRIWRKFEKIIYFKLEG